MAPVSAGDFLVRTIMSNVTGLPEDATVNDWAFSWVGVGAPVEADFLNLVGHVGDFFRLGATNPDKVGYFIGDAIDRAATHLIQVVSIEDGGSPVYEANWLGPVASGTDDNLPTEIAGVLSFHADLTGVSEGTVGVNERARRRGRVYIGPLNLIALDEAPANPTLSDAFLTAMRANAVVMADAALADDWLWVVWSRAGDMVNGVVGGWTDNAPDVQRRRGTAPSARVTFGPVGP